MQCKRGPEEREGRGAEKEEGAYLVYRNRNYRGGSQVVTMETFYWITGVLFCSSVNSRSYNRDLPSPRGGGAVDGQRAPRAKAEVCHVGGTRAWHT